MDVRDDRRRTSIVCRPRVCESEPLATLAIAAPAGGVVDLLQLVGGQRRRTFGSRRGLATSLRRAGPRLDQPVGDRRLKTARTAEIT